MYIITNQAMLLAMLLETIFLYVYTILLINKKLSRLQIRQVIFFTILGFLIYFVTDVFERWIPSEIIANLFILATLYGIFYEDFPQKDERRLLKINILLGYGLIQTVFLCVSFIQFKLFSNIAGVRGFGFVLFIQGIEFAILILILIAWRKMKVFKTIKMMDRKLLLRLLVIYDTTFVIFNVILNTLGFTKISQTEAFNISLLSFILIELVFAGIIFYISRKFQMQKYEKALMEQKLITLKKYTDTLEIEQRRLRKFKHDYQNLVLSLEEIVHEEHSELLSKYIETFKKYVNDNFDDSMLFFFNDFDNIGNSYLKSVMINQVSKDSNAGLKIHFECQKKTNAKIKIEDFDIVRIFGILLDNAREAALQSKAKTINIMIYQTENQLEVYIENSIDHPVDNFEKLQNEGHSTKEGHLGVGLSNISEFKQKYDNLLINYSQDPNFFKVNVIILN
nr:GHKL domain-containing protein [uncultured Ligilactobacillus sp.]